MARFGIEGIRRFGAARAAGFDADDLTYVFNICNGMDDQLRDAGTRGPSIGRTTTAGRLTCGAPRSVESMTTGQTM